MIEDEIDNAVEFLLDAAPVERAYIEQLTAELVPLGDISLITRIEESCMAYAQAAAERAFALGVNLGREAGEHAARLEQSTSAPVACK